MASTEPRITSSMFESLEEKQEMVTEPTPEPRRRDNQYLCSNVDLHRDNLRRLTLDNNGPPRIHRNVSQAVLAPCRSASTATPTSYSNFLMLTLLPLISGQLISWESFKEVIFQRHFFGLMRFIIGTVFIFGEKIRLLFRAFVEDNITTELISFFMDIVLVIYALGFLALSLLRAGLTI